MDTMILAVAGENYEYDTYLLLREFFPKEQILRLYENTGAFSWEEARNAQNAAAKDEEPKDPEQTDDIAGLLCRYEDERSLFTVLRNAVECRYEYPVEIGRTDKKEFKKSHMGNLYRLLNELTGRSLPWGNLTGVRPTKLARQMYEQGAGDEEVRAFYEKSRFVSAKKSTLAMEIAKREIKILSGIDPIKGYSLYIGIPFCPTRCAYCSFLSNPISKWQERIQEYLNCIEKELDYVKTAFAGRKPDTIYIGGGTPTALSADELKRLMEMIHQTLDVKDILEFTVEAGRPDSIRRDKLKVLKDAAVSRISVNPQTMNNETLEVIGRRHTAEQTIDAYALAREEGFDNINMDIILGLPGEGISHVEKTMEEILRLRPDSLTVHSLAMKRSAGMKDWTDSKFEEINQRTEQTGNGGYRESNSPERMMEIAYSGAERMGLLPYYLYRQKNIAGNLENVGFAREGKFGIYNILMMEEVQSIVALGAGTVSKCVRSKKDIRRCDTAKDIGLYMDRIEEMIERKRILFS